MNPSSRRALSGRSIATLALFTCLLLFGCKESTAGNGTAQGPGAPAAVGSTPKFRLKTLDGRVLGPADFRGKVVLVDFWATWCGPCHVQARALEPVYRDFKNRSVQFLAVNVGEDESTVRSFIQEQPVAYPVLLDPSSSASNELAVYALPTVMVIDKKGRISFLQPGFTDGDTLRRVLKEAGA